MRSLGFIDGRIVDIDALVVPLEDRGHQFGDGVYEVILAIGGKYVYLKEHLDRMERSCAEIRLVPSFSREEVENFCHQLLKESGMKDAMLYLQWTRGVAPRVHSFPPNTRSILSGTIRPAKVIPPELFANGARAIMVADERWLKCHVKSINLLGSVLTKQLAVEAGCFEAILVRDNKFVTEGSNSNSFAVKDNVIYTAPANNLILAGVTRAVVIAKAKEMGYTVREEFVSPQFYKEADEVFLTGTTTEVMPITILDNEPVRDGKVGPITKKLQEAYWRLIGKK